MDFLDRRDWPSLCVPYESHACQGAPPLKVLQASGPYLASQQGRYLLNFFCILVSGGGGAVVVGFVLHPILGLLLALALVRPAFRQYARGTRYRKGIRGEELVSSLLVSRPRSHVNEHAGGLCG